LLQQALHKVESGSTSRNDCGNAARVGRFIDKTEKKLFFLKTDSIDFSIDKKTKKTGGKSGNYLKLAEADHTREKKADF
jgi:hypothetical protein